MAFGAGLLLIIKISIEERGKRSGSWGALALVVAGMLGVLMNLFFPQDPGGPSVTFAGSVHVVLAAVLALGTILAIFCIGLWLRYLTDLRAYWIYSLISLVMMFISGGLSAAAIASGSPYLGLIERVTIGMFIQWVFVIALKLSTLSAANDTFTGKAVGSRL